MWTKDIEDMDWRDISEICPICDGRLENLGAYYGAVKCPKGHYELSCGNYHTDFIVNGELVATTDDMFNNKAHATLRRVIPEAREQWMKQNKRDFL
jgi:hypothetical protein